MKLLTLLFLLSVGFVYGQKAPNLSKFGSKQERLHAWAVYCDELIAVEAYPKLRVAGKRGLEMTNEKDYDNLSLFSFYVGMTFNYGIETDSAAYYLERSEKFGRKAKNSKRTLEALKQLHYVYGSYGESKKRSRIITEFNEVIDTTKNQIAKAEIYSVLGDYYINLGQYEVGLSNMLNGIKARRKVISTGSANDSTNLGVQLIVVSELYIALKKYDLALDYLNESETLIIDYKDATAHIYKDLVECYCAKNQLRNAKRAYAKLQELLKNETEISIWPLLLEADNVFANYYTSKLDYTNALFYGNHAKNLAPTYADDFLKAQIDVTLGQIYLKKKEFAIALAYFKAAEPTTSEDDPELIAQLKKALAETYEGLGQWKEAFRYQKEYAALQDKLLAEKSKKNVAEMEARYQNERKQGEIKELSSKNTINKLKIEEADQQLIYLLFVMLAVVVIGLLVYRQSRNRKQLNAKLQQLNEELKVVNANKTRFFSILNHDLRSPVANLIHFLQLQNESPDLIDEETKKRLELRTMQSAENLLRSMEDMLLWSKGQMKQFKPVIENLKISAVFAELENHFETDDSVEILVDKSTELELSTDFNYLLTILRNLTANSIKALEKTENPKITWSTRKIGNQTQLLINDNGPGATLSQFKALYDSSEVVGIKTGLGLHLIRDLAQAINCEIEVTSDGNGTTIILTF